MISPLERRLRQRGALVFRQLLDEHGGVYTETETADFLGLTPEALRTRALLAITFPDGDLTFPVWQFRDGQVVPLFEEVLALLETESSEAKVRFFLAWDEDLGTTRIDALRDGRDLDLVRRRAMQFGKQGAV